MKEKTAKKIRFLGKVLFVLYLAGLAYFLFFSERYGRTEPANIVQYNFIPFKEIKRFWYNRESLGYLASYMNLFGNILAFIPFGFCVPLMTKYRLGLFMTLFLIFSFSFVVETVQLVTKVGCFDVDDMILNTIGGLIGFIAFWIINGIRRIVFGIKKKSEKKR